MDDKAKQILQSILENELVVPEDIPNIELYMDQVTTFMEKHLAQNKRYADDKIMTKTMINNYTKNHLLPPSNKKKYSKEHIFLLILIYYSKNVMSISDIENYLSPLTSRYFPKNEENGISLESIYSQMIEMIKDKSTETEEQIMSSIDFCDHLFDDCEISDAERKELARFSLISKLSYDIYLRKQLIERLIDASQSTESGSKKDKNKK